MTTHSIDYTVFQHVPRWSPLPAAAYSLQDARLGTSPVPLPIQLDTALWNLYWAMLPRLGPTRLERLGPRIEAELRLVPSMSFRKPSGGSWSLAALMCAYPPAEYMQRYGNVISALLNLPSGYRYHLES